MKTEIEILKRRKARLEHTLDEWNEEHNDWPNRETKEMRRAVNTVLGLVNQHIRTLTQGGSIR